MEQQQVDYRHRDVRIGQIENGSEEIVVAVDQKAQEPRYIVPLKQREIEHVDDFSHHEPCVMAAEMGNRIGRRFGEQQSVECAVENVAHRSGENQRQTDDHP